MDKDVMIQNWINEICHQIPDYFHDDSKMKDNLEKFVLFENMEWYNIALLYYQKRDISFVLSKNNWDALLPEGKTFFIKKGQRGLRILLPYLDDEAVAYRDAVVWDISQADSPPEFSHVSNLKLTVESMKTDILEQIDMDSMTQYVVNIYHDEFNDDACIADFIYNCVYYILSLYVNGSSSLNATLVLNGLSDDTYIELYALLSYIMKNLHDTLKDYYDVLITRIQERKLREHAERISRMNIKERIIEAEDTIKRMQLAKMRENDEEFDLYDVDV